MRIAVLGPLEVVSDAGVPVTVPGAKERLLLAVLVAGAPGVVSRDRIEEILWNGKRPASARKSLQVHLVHLRSALEPDRPEGSTGRYVVRRGTGYALAAERDEVDALRIADLAARGRARLAAGDPTEAARLLSAALGLWRGEPYGDWPDASFAEAERRRLTEVRTGAVTALFEARLALGEHAEVAAEIQRLVVEEPLQEEWWRLLVLALYRCGRQGDALAAVARARAVLVEELGAEPGPRLRAVEAAVLAQDPGLDAPAPPSPAPSSPPDVTACPYKGLATYQAADAALFRGRTRVITRLVGRLVDSPLLVVSGSSGAGKSSLVRAGLVPALAGGALPGSARWRAVVLTPGRRPVDGLTPLTGKDPPAAPVLLVCDQLEELWAPGVDMPERTAFFDAVLGLLDDGIVVRCVAVVRGDHAGRLAEHAAFTERLGGAVALVPPLTDEELREVVRGPAETVGLTPDVELLDAVVADVVGRPAALPLLSTALVGTWERRRGTRLTLAGYLEAGGVAGALARSAEAAYAALDESGQRLARRLLVRLADVDDGGALVRRPVPVAELDLEAVEGGDRRSVLEAFISRRLLAVDGDRLEVTHEALLTGWPRLARWLEDDVAGRAVRRHLTPTALAWDAGGRPDEELYRGARLSAALDAATGPAANVTPIEQQFLDASRGRADAELTEARERARREGAARRRTRRLAIGLAAALVLALVAAGAAVRSERAAERAYLVADANRLAGQSSTTGELELSMLLAAQGFRLADTGRTQETLRATLDDHRRALRVGPLSPYTAEASLGDGGRTLFVLVGENLFSWPVLDGGAPRAEGRLPAQWVTRTALDASPTDRTLAAAGSLSGRPWVRLVDLEDGERLVSGSDAVGGDPFALSFTADGRLLKLFVASPVGPGGGSAWQLVEVDPATGARRDTGIGGVLPGGEPSADVSDDATTALLWTMPEAAPPIVLDLATGEQSRLQAVARDVESIGYRALRSGAAQLWADGVVTLYDRSGGVMQRLDRHPAPVRDVVLGPEGTWAATVGDGAAVILWNVDPVTGHWAPRENVHGHRLDVQDAEVDPQGGRILTLSEGDAVIAWDAGQDVASGARASADPSDWLAQACAVVGRDFTRSEWNLYLPGRPWQPTCTDLD